MQVSARQDDTIDLLVWRHLGSTAGYVEQTLELNPSIARYGPVLPRGTLVTLPDPKAVAPLMQDILQLWD